MAERRNFADVLKQVYGTEIINWDGFKGRGAGRRGGNPQGAIVHNDYGAANGKGYINWLTDARLGNPSAGYAHYYGDRKYMMRAVPTYQGAWHAGDYARGNFTGHGKPANWGNMQLLGYEVNQSRHFATTNREFRLNEEAVFIMIAEDFLFYGLVPNRQTVWLHNEFTSTSCPHRSWELHVGTGASYNQANRNKLKDYFVGRIQYWMDVLNHKRPIPAKNYLPEDGEPQEVNPSDKTYIVQKGDYLYKIGEMFGVDWKDIKVWNNLEANVIYTGQELIVSADLYNPPVEEPEVVEPDNNNTPDIDTEIVDEVEGDEETPALELEENQYLRWDGKIVEVREVK